MRLSSWQVGLGAILLSLPLAASGADEATPSAEEVLGRMKAALEPAKPVMRTMTLQVYSAAFKERTEVVAHQARKHFPEGERTVTIVTAPESLKGVSLLVVERKDEPNMQHVYYPSLRRIRRVSGIESFEPFLGTDFTYADLGLIETRRHSLELLGTAERDGKTAYQLQEKPAIPGYYTRIVDWVATDSGLPLEREYYDVANRLWRKQIFADVVKVDGIPTPTRIRVNDVQSGDRSEIKVSAVRYDAKMPDEIFDPARLREASGNAVWTAGR